MDYELAQALAQGFRGAGEAAQWGMLLGAGGSNPGIMPSVLQGMFQAQNQPKVFEEQRNQMLGNAIIQGIQQGIIPWETAGPALEKLGYNTRGMSVQYPENERLLLERISAMPGSRDPQGGWTDAGRWRLTQAIPAYADKILKQEALMNSEQALADVRRVREEMLIEQEKKDQRAAAIEERYRNDPRYNYGRNVSAASLGGAAPISGAAPAAAGVPPTGMEPEPGRMQRLSGEYQTAESPDIQLREAPADQQQAAWTDYATGVQTRGIAPPPSEGKPIAPDEVLPGENEDNLKEMNAAADATMSEQKVTAEGPPEVPEDLRRKAQMHEAISADQRVAGATKQAGENAKQAHQLRIDAHNLERDLLLQEREMRLKALADLKKQAQKAAEDDKDGIHQLAMNWLMNGKEPPRRGAVAEALYGRALTEMTRIGKAMGLSPEEISRLPYDNVAKQKAVNRLTDWAGSVSRLQKELEKDIDVAISYAKQFNPSQLKTLNKAILSGQIEFNDPIASGYATAVQTVQNKYGRVIAGPTSNAMIPVEAMKHAHDVVSTGATVPAWQEIKRVMMLDANNTLTSTTDTIDNFKKSILSGGKQGAFPPASIPASQVEFGAEKRGGQTVQGVTSGMSATNPKTGEKLYSDDGGKTWHK